MHTSDDLDKNISEPDEHGASVFEAAVRDGNEMLVAAMLDNGFTPDRRLRDSFDTPVIAAAALEGRLGVVRLLIQAGADVNAQDGLGRTALIYAAAAGRADLVLELIRARAEKSRVDHQGLVARLIAAYRGHYQVIDALSASHEIRD